MSLLFHVFLNWWQKGRGSPKLTMLTWPVQGILSTQLGYFCCLLPASGDGGPETYPNTSCAINSREQAESLCSLGAFLIIPLQATTWIACLESQFCWLRRLIWVDTGICGINYTYISSVEECSGNFKEPKVSSEKDFSNWNSVLRSVLRLTVSYSLGNALGRTMWSCQILESHLIMSSIVVSGHFMSRHILFTVQKIWPSSCKRRVPFVKQSW